MSLQIVTRKYVFLFFDFFYIYEIVSYIHEIFNYIHEIVRCIDELVNYNSLSTQYDRT